MHIGVEMSFRDEYLLGPTILYAELIEKALCVVSRLESIGRHSFEYALRARSPCFLCAMNLRNSGPAKRPHDRASIADVTTARCAPLLADWRPRGAAGSVQSVLDASAPELLQHYADSILSLRSAPMGRWIFQPKETCCRTYTIMSHAIRIHSWLVVPRRPIKIGQL